MKKRIIIAICATAIKISVIACIIVCIILAYFNSNCYYSKKLVDAIKAEDIVEVKHVLEEKPSCINTLPTLMPRGLNILLTERVPDYPLIVACATDNIDIVKLLIENGADVNCNNGMTPLSVTYQIKAENWYAISVLLIENGADINYVTSYSGGKSSIFIDIVQKRSGSAYPDYVAESNTEVIAAFNYALENCNHSQVNWVRALNESAYCDRIEIVERLLDGKYCDVNDTSDDLTALMFAAMVSEPEMVELLLDKGADKSIKDSKGKTALDYAIEYGNDEVVAFLSD